MNRATRLVALLFLAVLAAACSDPLEVADVDVRAMGEFVAGSSQSTIELLGDVDGDGHADIAIGAYGRDGELGSLAAISWIANREIWRIKADPSESELGRSLVTVGDVDGDGAGDIAVGRPEHGDVGLRPRFSSLELRSGRSGELLHKVESRHANDGLGYFMLATDDLDGDGTNDLLVGAPTRYRSPSRSGAIDLRSGRTLELIQEIRLPDPNNLGFGFVLVDDLDGGGTRDIVATALGASVISAVSVERGAVLWSTRLDCESVHLLGTCASSTSKHAVVLVRMEKKKGGFARLKQILSLDASTGRALGEAREGQAAACIDEFDGTNSQLLLAPVGKALECVELSSSRRIALSSPVLDEFMELQERLESIRVLGDLDSDGRLEVAIMGRQLEKSGSIVDWARSRSVIIVVSIPAGLMGSMRN
jgi:hypothetical protein